MLRELIHGVNQRSVTSCDELGIEFERLRLGIPSIPKRLGQSEHLAEPEAAELLDDLSANRRASDRILGPGVRIGGAGAGEQDQLAELFAREHLGGQRLAIMLCPIDLGGASCSDVCTLIQVANPRLPSEACIRISNEANRRISLYGHHGEAHPQAGRVRLGR